MARCYQKLIQLRKVDVTSVQHLVPHLDQLDDEPNENLYNELLQRNTVFEVAVVIRNQVKLILSQIDLFVRQLNGTTEEVSENLKKCGDHLVALLLRMHQVFQVLHRRLDSLLSDQNATERIPFP